MLGTVTSFFGSVGFLSVDFGSVGFRQAVTGPGSIRGRQALAQSSGAETRPTTALEIPR
ncbi:hypothetical protein [Frankia tisae]|uniref:hypothetical protein n=1 Tax=Frankia tisae TaxID=2950104 RepID=UPI0021C1286D|nr:hypothetical protein [Frankia tisae]